jgi:hypothetical protein
MGDKSKEIASLSAKELLIFHAKISDELRNRGITRSANNPTGDLAEYLFCKAFDWVQSGNSSPNVDATGKDGTLYQIKGRRLTRLSKSRQLSAIRDFAGRHFDFLAAILFTEEYAVFRAALVPYAVVEQRAKFVAHTNSHKFILHDDVWKAPGVQDVTERIRATAF